MGLYLPPKIQTSADLAPMIGRSAQWINEKSGVKERRISELDVDIMGAIAGKEALNNKPPDLIINASGVPKQTMSTTSIFYQKRNGL